MPFDALMQANGFIPANHVKPEWFDVELLPIYDADGRPIPGYKRAQRMDTGDTMAVHTEKYALIPYKVQFDAFEDALSRSGLQLRDMAIASDLSHNGARCFRQYVLPSYQIDLPNGRNLALRFIMFGSYDGSMSFHGRCGGYDFVCANTSVMGKDILDLRVKHVGREEDLELRIRRAIEELVKAARSYLDNRERLQAWVQIAVDPLSAKGLFGCLPQATEKLVDHLMSRYAVHEQKTLWGVWDTLTTWSTHGEAKRNKAQVKSDREQRVTTLVEGRDWHQFETA